MRCRGNALFMKMGAFNGEDLSPWRRFPALRLSLKRRHRHMAGSDKALPHKAETLARGMRSFMGGLITY
jgi:hypothetical protein